MTKKIFTIAIILILLSTTLAGAPQIKASGKTVVVPDDYPTIQAAIGNATADGTIFVKSGIYHETLTIEKPLSLIGEDSQNTVIVGIWYRYGQTPSPVQISADNVTVSGFTIKDSGSAGIWVENIGSNKQPLNCRITGNNIMNASTGIRTYGMSNPTTGIKHPSNLLISGNNITQNGGFGIYCTTSNSTISGNNIVANSAEGIIIDECVNVTINGNNITGNSRGLLLRWWGPFYVFDNNITDMGAGVVFGEYCNNSTISQNNIAKNNVGFQLENVGDPDLIGKYNTVYHNNIVDNYQQSTVDLNSDVVSWDNGAAGNYWSDYLTKYPNAAEVDSTGIGNSPYVIDSNNSDHYPLMRQVDISVTMPSPIASVNPSPSIPELPTCMILLLVLICAISANLLIMKKEKTFLNAG